jgi:hypothetical protein
MSVLPGPPTIQADQLNGGNCDHPVSIHLEPCSIPASESLLLIIGTALRPEKRGYGRPGERRSAHECEEGGSWWKW